MNRRRFTIAVIFAAFFAHNIWSQTTAADPSKQPTVRLGKPRIISITPSNIEFELTAELLGIPRDGRIERLSFQGFTANGVKFEVEEFIVPFDVKKGKPATLPTPLRCRIKMTDAARKLIRDALDSREKWQIDGVTTIHASARKFGFRFKRDLTMPVSMKIENPLPYR